MAVECVGLVLEVEIEVVLCCEDRVQRRGRRLFYSFLCAKIGLSLGANPELAGSHYSSPFYCL